MSHLDRVAHDRGERGFSLLEALIATSIVTVALGAVAQLSVTALQATRSARATTIASILAEQKMEQLRALVWSFDGLGVPLSDITSDTTAVPARPAGGTGLDRSPADALHGNIAGYCDFLDAHGESLGGGTTPPPGTVYVRRWSLDPLPSSPDDALVVQVLVTPVARAGLPAGAGTRRAPGDATLVAVRTRKAP